MGQALHGDYARPLSILGVGFASVGCLERSEIEGVLMGIPLRDGALANQHAARRVGVDVLRKNG